LIAGVDSEFENLLRLAPISDYEITLPPTGTMLDTHGQVCRIRYGYTNTVMKNLIVNRGKYFKWNLKRLRRSYTSDRPRGRRDLIMTVNLLAPQNRSLDTGEPQQPYRNRCEVKMLVCGETLLTDLCDKISCPSSLWSHCPITPGEARPDADNNFGNTYPSRFLFIHDTFYVDLVNERVDPTEKIREFMDRKSEVIGHYTTTSMEGVRVSDLTLRLGQPYVFQHQGICEHLVIFSDMRLLNASDEQLVEKYPIKVYDSRLDVLCRVCKKVMASCVITESEALPLLPFHMCASCFDDFNEPEDCVVYPHTDPRD